MAIRSISACLAAVAVAAGGPASGDVLIQSTGPGGKTGRVLITGDRARIDKGDADVYMLLDLARGRMLAVNDKERFAMDMQSPMPRRPEHGELITAVVERPEIRLEKLGDGPVIAGYRTLHYRVMANDAHCLDEYLAPAALDDAALQRFLKIMSEGSHDEERRVLIQITSPEYLCDAAEDLLDDHYPTLGIPMRTLDSRGRVTHEITRIDLDAAHPPESFEPPADYPVLTRVEVMNRTDTAGGSR